MNIGLNNDCRNIFVFWESNNVIPAYLELCKQTWEKNIPNSTIHIINYNNIHHYINNVYDIEKLKKIPLAMQSDVISAALLEKFGGLFLDIDCIVIDDIFEIFQQISKEQLIAFGRPNEKAIHLAVLYCHLPNNPILKEWRKEAQNRLNDLPETYKWNYFGNAIIDPLLKDDKYQDNFYIIDRSISGNILESIAYMDSDLSRAITDYKNFYFNKYFIINPKILDKVQCGVISLHNSWTPENYKKIIDCSEFLNQEIPIANLIRYVLNNHTKNLYRNSIFLVESYLILKLKEHNIKYTKKYFKNKLVIDLNNHQGLKFAFDISVINNLIIMDFILRNSHVSVLENIDIFKNLNFSSNKVTNFYISVDKQDIFIKIQQILQLLSSIEIALELLVNPYFKNAVVTKESIVSLEKIDIKNDLLFIEGIAIIRGTNVKEWSDINYYLIFQGNEVSYEKLLAKAHRSELTQAFINDGKTYDKCWFTTKNYAGIDISDVLLGDYKLLLKIIIANKVVTLPLISSLSRKFSNEQFEFSINKTNYFSLKSHISSVSITEFSDKKILMNGKYIDSQNNVVYAPTNLTNCYVRFLGSNNCIKIHSNANLKNVFIECLGDNANVEISEHVTVSGMWRLGYNCSLIIGKKSSSTNPVYMTCAEGTKIIIGEDCMFATNNQIRTDDAHAIYDVGTGKRINYSKDIIIGDHVWIGYGATLLGGANIGSGSVIGAFALVKKLIPNNCIATGMPAKVVKKNIFWERPLLLSSKIDASSSFCKSELANRFYINPTKIEE